MDVTIKEAVLQTVAKITNIQLEDLTEMVGDDLVSTDDIFDAIKPVVTRWKNDTRDEQINKGYRQASKKTERLMKEVFNDFEFEGKTQEDYFMQLRDEMSNKSTPTTKSKITLQQALQSDEIKAEFERFKQYENQYNSLQKEFEDYKNLQLVQSAAMNVLSSLGANFSSNPTIRERQEKAFIQELKNHKFKKLEDGKLAVVDEDGNPLYNKQTADYYQFDDFVRSLSPVDFVEKKQDNKVYTPSNSSKVSNPLGMTAEQIKGLTIDDYYAAKNSGDTERANAIYEQMKQNIANG